MKPLTAMSPVGTNRTSSNVRSSVAIGGKPDMARTSSNRREWYLPDVSAARREAKLSAREILAGAIRAGQAMVPDAFVISDEAGRVFDTVPLAEVLPEPLKK